MRILSVTSVLRCEGCDKDGARVKIASAGQDQKCPKWRRAWNRKLRKLKEDGWLIRTRRRRDRGLCPDCLAIIEARGVFVPCDDATAPETFVKKTCILMKNHPGRHANANGGRWGEDRERVAEPGLAPIRKMGGFKEVS